MIVTVDEIVQKLSQDFAKKYPHFKDFQTDSSYSAYWGLCIQAMQDRDLLGHIVFCNNLFYIPPAKTFLCFYADALKNITGKENAQLSDYVKKSIGAVWGFVFKFIFLYQGQKSVSVSLNRLFMLKTATYYTNPQKVLVLAY